jgi:SAM-dependent methyltransferase
VNDLGFSPAAERNKVPILSALQRLLPARADVLEIASGTGQHAQHFASARPGWTWQPSDVDPAALPAIDARCQGLVNVRRALQLDVCAMPWPVEPARFDALYCANMLHAAPWAVCPALMYGAARHLRDGGRLLLYGPYRVDGVATAPGNEAFDVDLKARDPAWGLRTLGSVESEARAAGLALQQQLPLPANNLLLVFACTS